MDAGRLLQLKSLCFHSVILALSSDQDFLSSKRSWLLDYVGEYGAAMRVLNCFASIVFQQASVAK